MKLNDLCGVNSEERECHMFAQEHCRPNVSWSKINLTEKRRCARLTNAYFL